MKRKKKTTRKVKEITTSRKPTKMTEQLQVLDPIHASTVKEGTAHIEPQFICYRHGDKFVTANSFKDLHKGLIQAEELEEQIVAINFSMEGYPLDCIVQVNKAIEKVYGFSHAKERMSFFGPQPPIRLNIQTGPGPEDSVHCVYGQMAPPSWEGGAIGISVDMGNPLSLAISGQIKRKFEPAIKGIVTLARKLLKEESIYRGHAVEVSLGYIEDGKFDPTHSAPKFIPVNEEIELILPRDVEFEIQTNVWNIMTNPQIFRRNGIPIKSGVQLDGGAGTGKTLTAYKTAQVATENGWTYIYLKSPLTSKTFLSGYKLAQMYGPSIFFVEDNDVLFGKDRDEEMNSMLEALDGITAKNAEVITIFTTNYPERLNKTFKRSGRINHEITLRAPDAEAAGRFVKRMAGDYLSNDVDIEKVGEAFKNLVPSDIKNGIDQAKKNCLGVENKEDITGLVTTDMLCVAAEVVQRKAGRNTGEEEPAKRTLRRIKTGLSELFPDVTKDGEDIKSIRRTVEEIKESME